MGEEATVAPVACLPAWALVWVLVWVLARMQKSKPLNHSSW